MKHTAYSFDPRLQTPEFADLETDTRTRHFSLERRSASWQHEDGDDEPQKQVADIVASTQPLRLRT